MSADVKLADAPMTGEAVRELALEVLRIRHWQHIMNEHLKQKRFKIPIHVSIGYEALAVAIHHMMADDDQLVLTHRNMSYNLARAGGLTPLYREYLLAPDSMARGVLGSMNLAQPDRGIAYSSSILGNNLPVACGLALANAIHERRALVTVLTGDGAMEEGTFYESLVFAKSQNLRVLFLVEDNNQSMSSTISERRCPIDLDKMCQSIAIPFRALSGNDVVHYVAELQAARELVLDDNAPACVTATVRAFCQHAGPTPGWPTDPKKIKLEDGLMVESSLDDPLYVLRKRVGDSLFDAWCQQVRAESWEAA
jgi:TPP-dependent pyruvate/acetoin dehydrogenase alpha subunit